VQVDHRPGFESLPSASSFHNRHDKLPDFESWMSTVTGVFLDRQRPVSACLFVSRNRHDIECLIEFSCSLPDDELPVCRRQSLLLLADSDCFR